MDDRLGNVRSQLSASADPHARSGPVEGSNSAAVPMANVGMVSALKLVAVAAQSGTPRRAGSAHPLFEVRNRQTAAASRAAGLAQVVLAPRRARASCTLMP